MKRPTIAFVLLALIAILLAGCGFSSEPATATPTPKPTARATATRVPSPTPKATSTPAPTPRPKPVEPNKQSEPTPVAEDPAKSWPKTDILRLTNWNITDQSYPQDGQLHLESNADGKYWKSWSRYADFADMVYEMDVTKTKGPDDYGYGPIFQIREAADEFMLFEITGNGSYRVDFNSKGEWNSLTDWTSSNAIQQGNSLNKIKVVIQGDKAQFYINGQMITTLTITPGRGYVGAYSGQKGLHIVVSKMDVYAPK